MRNRWVAISAFLFVMIIVSFYAAHQLRGAGGAWASGPQAAAKYVGPAKCLECHDDKSKSWGSNPHAAPTAKMTDASLNGCEACHGPGSLHADGDAKLIFNPAKADKEQLVSICGRCHIDSKSGTPPEWRKLGDAWRASMHFRKDVLCVKCHTIHGGADKLLSAKPEELCVKCHAERPGYVHTPVKNGMCADCHNPHGDALPHMVRPKVADTCNGCHDVTKPEDIKKHGGMNVQGRNCVVCHDPHSSKKEDALLRPVRHKPYQDGKCDTCHQGAKAANPFALKEAPGELCAMCHSDIVKKATSAAFPHYPAKQKLCIGCHNPHDSDNKALLKDRPEVMCVACHQKVGAQLAGKFQHPPVANGTCSDCHDAHGSDHERLLKKDPDALCTSCHPTIKFSHPMVAQNLNPDLGPVIRCYTCHSVHGANVAKLLPMPESDMCNQCHHKNSGGMDMAH